MSYQVLARKWRPQDFSSLVGQEHLVTALRNALVEGRIAQAYLFSGIRGVGKTTAARVLAKALNCERGPAADPCNECPTCLEIASGASLDVLEVDAATYSKVEQVRELTETLRYGPARSRYKVVVLDEVHRLSRQAFDALLKIVEEPPPHLVFIFATTEIDAVPATILSRCQEFQFKRVPSPVLAEHLRTISAAESIEVSDPALRLIARAGEGSVRDSVALLDQMATFGGGAISDAEAQQLLGGLDSAIFLRLLGALVGGESSEVVAVVREIERNGWDPQNVFGQFLGYLRDALHLALAPGAPNLADVDLPEEEAKALADAVRPIGPEALLQILQLLLGSEPTVRRSEFGLLALEIAWLRAAELPKVQSIQRLLESGGVAPASGPASGPGSGPASGSPGGRPTGGGTPSGGSTGGRYGSPAGGGPRGRSSQGAATATEEQTAVEPIESRDVASRDAATRDVETRDDDSTGPSSTAQPPEGGLERLPALFEILSSRRQPLAAQLRTARIELRGATLHLAPRDAMLSRALTRPRNADAFAQAVQEVWGPGMRWRVDEVTVPVDPGPTGSLRADPPPDVDGRETNGRRPMNGVRNGHGRGRPRSADARSTNGSSPSRRGADRPADTGPGDAVLAGVAEDLPVVQTIVNLFDGKILDVSSEEEVAR